MKYLDPWVIKTKGGEMIFVNVFSPKSVIIDLESEEKDELFEEMLESIRLTHPEIDHEEALSALKEREAQMSTGIMHGIAVPHGRCKSVKGCVGAVGISRRGIDYDSLDGAAVNLVFMLLCGENDDELHLEILKELSQVLHDPSFVSKIYDKKSAQEVYDLLCEIQD